MEDSRELIEQNQIVPAKILSALVRAQKVVLDVQKSKFVPAGKNGSGYLVAEGENVIDAGLKALHHPEVNLGVMQYAWKTLGAEDPESREDKYGNVTLTYTMLVKYMLFSIEGESAIFGPYPTPVIIAAGKPADKAEAAALSYNYSYFMRALLGILRFEETGGNKVETTQQLPERHQGYNPDDRDDRDFSPGVRRTKPHDTEKSPAFSEISKLHKERPKRLEEARKIYEREHGKPASRHNEDSLLEVISIYHNMSKIENMQETIQPWELEKTADQRAMEETGSEAEW